MSERIDIARVGRKVGLKGFLKLQIFSDFPEFFAPGRTIRAVRGEETRDLVVDIFHADRDEIRFRGFNTPETASTLTHFILTATIEETREAIKLQEGEHFWFDIIGLPVYEGETRLGTVENIVESGQTYLDIALEPEHAQKQRHLMLPWVDHFVIGVSPDQKSVQVVRALDLLEAL